MTEKELAFFKGKRILVTGHTGFKGSWLVRILLYAGASVIGYSLAPEEESLFRLSIDSGMTERDGSIPGEKVYKDEESGGMLYSVIGDIRDFERLCSVFRKYAPELVIHMAAQPIVRTSYEKPRYTYETNVMGTVNICEAVRLFPSVKSFLNVTTDKVYKNEEQGEAFREDAPLDGYDPYSNSKSCSELVTHSYVNSYFRGMGIPTSTARAGNVIGGGDFARDRIIPDCVRTALGYENMVQGKTTTIAETDKADKNEELCKLNTGAVNDKLCKLNAGMAGDGPVIRVRNPYSIRPFQHVLEPLFMYLTILRAQYLDPGLAGAYNIGPEDVDCVTTGDLVTRFCKAWNEAKSEDETSLSWEDVGNAGPHESSFLKLDCRLARSTFGWKPVWNIDRALLETVNWTRAYMGSGIGESAGEKKMDGQEMDGQKMIRREMNREIGMFLRSSMNELCE